MFTLSVPFWESLFLVIRLTGKREVGELAPFDLVFLLLVSEQVSPSLTGDDESIAAALVGLAVLLCLNAALTWVTQRSARAERWLEGRPQFLVRNGKVDYKRMRREGVSKIDLLAALRENGCMRPTQAVWAVLETDGSISVLKKTESAG
jgi:uncharacterized membrane protein YcaP (DUF421 family)